MAKKLNLPSCDHTTEDDYIDMDITSTTFFSAPHSREFEFQMSINMPEKEADTSPADELFYKGKLLPLHLPPRIEMVQKLLQTPADLHDGNTEESDSMQDNHLLPVSESSKNSADNSCHVSGELNPEECNTSQSQPKKSWSKKLKLINHSSLSLKLKASRAYLKSLFTKSGCSNESDTAPKVKVKEEKNPLEKFQAVTTLMRSIEREKLLEEECNHRKSFSGAINCQWTTKSSPAISSCSSSSSSSFSSVNSNRFCGSQVLNRSSSVNSEMESSIQGAIAHCKKSQVRARKSVSDVEFCSLSASRIVAACENKERPGLCRG